MLQNNNIAWQKCRAHNVNACKSIDFLPALKSCDIKQFRMLCINGDGPPLPGAATPRIHHSLYKQKLEWLKEYCINRSWSNEKICIQRKLD